MRFNPPPNWPPTPPGWTPPAGWQPDPTWPYPPPGWQLWVPDDRPPRSKGPLIAGIVGGVVLLAVLAVVLVFVVFKKDAKPLSDDEQIRQLVVAAVDAWNSSDFSKFKDITCRADRDDDDFTEANFKKARKGQGRVEITVKLDKVNGDRATAETETKYEKDDKPDDLDQDFLKEGGVWKYCSDG